MDKDILKEALQIDCQLRSTFFYRKLQELGFSSFFDEIEKLIKISDNFNWEATDYSSSSFRIDNFSNGNICDDSARLYLENWYAGLLEETTEFNRKSFTPT